MKIKHQNIGQSLRKREVYNYHFQTSKNSLNFRTTSYFSSAGQMLKIDKTIFQQWDLFLKKKEENNEESKKKIIVNKIGEKGFDFIQRFVNIGSDKTQLIVSGKEKKAVGDVYDNAVSIKRLNSISNLDYFLVKINGNLSNKGKFIGMVQTNKQHKQNQWIQKIPIIGKLSAFVGFLFHRVCPKIKGISNLYFSLTQGRQLRLSKASVLGRLIKFGFKIIEIEEDINGAMYFVVEKIKAPDLKSRASNGLIYKFPRVGKNGKIFGVYKIRTMHPYSEYLQDYIVNTNGYGSNGKPSKDFRIPSWAKFVRRYWLDELPQLINVIKGEMKLLGVRPVTERYLQDIPEHIKKIRLTQKPGCIPPYIAYNKASSKESVLRAEENYLKLPKKGILVDIKLIAFAIKNILVSKKRGA
ncbi:MAG: lipopolysaccharide/colanic/teichoic acid biosynthesis glycosyltransferase [Crocinitomix sp.]|jgi:lipopolysaccharide/colanic/teichoic acid biosynthesis glycosyltransferase